MPGYLSYKFEDSEQLVNTFDELPLWSAPFGLLLLKHLEYKPDITILDIGSGAGFPLMEIAARFGESCRCYGLDVWRNANERAKQKVINYGLGNVEVIEGSAESIPFSDNSIDLIVSNLGINNFENPDTVFGECYRVLRPRGKLALTTNLNGHWKEFYEVFEATLRQLGKEDIVAKLEEHQQHRGTTETISELFTRQGMHVSNYHTESFNMHFLNGSAFLDHYFVKLGWLGSWMELVKGEDVAGIFSLLEQKLNEVAGRSGCLKLTVPMAFIEGIKSV